MDCILTFVTGNAGKLREAQAVLGTNITQHNIDLPEIQSMDVEEVCTEKVKLAYSQLNIPVIVEDTGVYIHNMNGFPGALIKFYEKTVGLEEISKRDGGSQVYVKSSIAYYDGKDLKVFSGIINGTVAKSVQKGSYGFGWDPIFIPNDVFISNSSEKISFNGKSFAQITLKEKLSVSQRGIALRELKKYLNNK